MTNREFYEGLTDAQLEQMKVTLVEEIKQRKEFADKQQNQKPKDPLENVFVPHDEHYYITDLDKVILIRPEKYEGNAFNFYSCDEYTREEVERIALQLRAFRKLQFAAKRLKLKLNLNGFEQLGLFIREGSLAEFNLIFGLITEEERKAFEV